MKPKPLNIFSSLKKTILFLIATHLFILLVSSTLIFHSYFSLYYPGITIPFSRHHVLDYFIIKRSTYILDQDFQHYLKTHFYPVTYKKSAILYRFFNPPHKYNIPIAYSRKDFKQLVNLIFASKFKRSEIHFKKCFLLSFGVYIILLYLICRKFFRYLHDHFKQVDSKNKDLRLNND